MVICKKLKKFFLVAVIFLLTTVLFLYSCKDRNESGTPDAGLIKMELVGVRIHADTMSPVVLLKEEEGDRDQTDDDDQVQEDQQRVHARESPFLARQARWPGQC